MNIVRIISCGAIVQLLWMAAGCCKEMAPVMYEWSRMELAHLDNSRETPVESRSGSIPAGAYGIRIKLYPGEIASTEFQPIAVAYATSCEHQYINRDRITAMHVHAITGGAPDAPQDVTNEFLPLNPIFFGKFFTIPELMEWMNTNHLGISTGVDLIHMKNAVPTDDTRFIVTVELDDGRMFADTTDPVILF